MSRFLGNGARRIAAAFGPSSAKAKAKAKGATALPPGAIVLVNVYVANAPSPG